jgi:hypothetical protein
MLNPCQVANVLNQNIKEGIPYSEKSVQKFIWKLLKKRYFVDPLQEVVVDTCWATDSDSKYPWNLYKISNFKEAYKTAIVELPTPGEKLAKKEIDVADTFYRMYTGRVIPLVPLEPSHGNGQGQSSSGGNNKGNLLNDVSGDPMTTTSNTTTNLKSVSSISPTTTSTNKRVPGTLNGNQLY